MRRSRNANIGGSSRREVIGVPARRDRRRNSSTRSSSSNAATPALAVPALHRRLRTPLASISTKTSSAGCSGKLWTGGRNRWPVLAELYRTCCRLAVARLARRAAHSGGCASAHVRAGADLEATKFQPAATGLVAARRSDENATGVRKDCPLSEDPQLRP
jgi:hypothetical protein